MLLLKEVHAKLHSPRAWILHHLMTRQLFLQLLTSSARSPHHKRQGMAASRLTSMSFQTKSEPLQMSIDKFNNSPRDDVGGSWMSSTLTYCFPEEALLRKQRTSQPQNTQDLCIGIAERGQNALCYIFVRLGGKRSWPSLHHMQINASFFWCLYWIAKKTKGKATTKPIQKDTVKVVIKISPKSLDRISKCLGWIQRASFKPNLTESQQKKRKVGKSAWRGPKITVLKTKSL